MAPTLWNGFPALLDSIVRFRRRWIRRWKQSCRRSARIAGAQSPKTTSSTSIKLRSRSRAWSGFVFACTSVAASSAGGPSRVVIPANFGRQRRRRAAVGAARGGPGHATEQGSGTALWQDLGGAQAGLRAGSDARRGVSGDCARRPQGRTHIPLKPSSSVYSVLQSHKSSTWRLPICRRPACR